MELTSHFALPELTALATRDENFAALVARQSRFVFRVAYSVLRNAQDAEDVVQDTFFKLHRSGAWRQMQVGLKLIPIRHCSVEADGAVRRFR